MTEIVTVSSLREELERLRANVDNLYRRRCKIGKVVPKRLSGIARPALPGWPQVQPLHYYERPRCSCPPGGVCANAFCPKRMNVAC